MTLSIDHADFAYHAGRPVLRDVSIAAPHGAFVAIVGPNGAGKSTLLRIAAGLLAPTRGAVSLDNEPVHRLAPRTRAARIAYIAQQPSVAAGFTVREIVSLGRFALARDEDAVSYALDRTQLDDRANIPFHELSAGQQQRVAIARALAQVDPPRGRADGRCIIADEPTAALDPRHVRLTLDLLLDFTSRGGTAVASLHDLSAALRHAHKALLLGPDGSPIVSGPADTTLTPAHLRAAFGAEFAIGEVAGARVVTTI